MWGADGSIYFVGDPLPNEKSVIPGSLDVRKSVNNIYKIPVEGRHPDAGDPAYRRQPVLAVDVERRQGHRLRGQLRHLEAGRRVRQVQRNQAGHLLGRKAERGRVRDDHERSRHVRPLAVGPPRRHFRARADLHDCDRARRHHARRAGQDGVQESAPKWSDDGKLLAFVSDRSGRDEIWVSDPEGRTPKKITDLDNEKGALVWTPDSTALLYTAADKKLYSYNVADGKTAVVASSDVGRIGSVDVSPDSKWIAFSKQDRTLRSHVYIVPIAGGEERHISDDSLLYSETNAIWTADGRYLVFTSSEGASGIASQGGISTTMALWALSLRDQDRDPTNRDIDNEAQGLAAEAAARQNTGRGGWPGRRAGARGSHRLERPGATRAAALGARERRSADSRPSPEGHSVALTASTAGLGGGRGGAPDANAGMYIINVESGQLTRVPPAPESAGAGAGRGGRGGAAGGSGGGGSSMAFARDGRTLYFRSGSGLFAAPINLAGTGGGAAQAGAGGGRGGGRGGRRRRANRDRTGGQCDGASGDLHRQHRGRSQGAPRPGLQRGLADHEEPLLRPEDARRGLGRGEDRLRAAPRLPRGRRGAEHGHDDDDRPAQRVAYRSERRRTGQRQSAGAADAPARDSIWRRTRPASTRSPTSTRTARPITTT